MNNLPYFSINIRSKLTWEEDFANSWDIYCKTVLDNWEYGMYASTYNYIYTNTRSWVYYIISIYHDYNPGEEFYVEYKTPSFTLNVKLHIKDLKDA